MTLFVYPWEDAPTWANWAVTEANGNMCWFEKQPWPSQTHGLFVNGGKVMLFHRGANDQACADWVGSLQARPVPWRDRIDAMLKAAQEPMTEFDWAQLEMAAAGCTSGIENWPALRLAIKKIVVHRGKT